jgi:hypothetical protein
MTARAKLKDIIDGIGINSESVATYTNAGREIICSCQKLKCRGTIMNIEKLIGCFIRDKSLIYFVGARFILWIRWIVPIPSFLKKSHYFFKFHLCRHP